VDISHTITQCEQGMASMSLISDARAESSADVVSTATAANTQLKCLCLQRLLKLCA
jgi:hypothetical protein